MNTQEQKRAKVLDARLDDLQRGSNIHSRPDWADGDERNFLVELVALAGAQQPDPSFAAELESRLMMAARKGLSPRPALLRRPSLLQRLLNLTGVKETKMSKPIALLLAGAMLLAVILIGVYAIMSWAWLPEGPSQLAEFSTAAPTLSVVETATPEPMTPLASPTRVTPEPTPVATAAEVIPTPTIPIPTWPAEPPALPVLASQLIGGIGGSGGGSETVPPEVSFILSTTLPEGPAQLTVWGQALEPLTVQRTVELATDWGLEASVYMPIWMADAPALTEFGRRDYFAVDDPRQLAFEGIELIHYWDRSVFPAHGGRINPPADLPPVEQAIQLATDFLQTRGLLNVAYEVRPLNYESTGTINFFRLLDDQWSLLGPFAQVTLGADGRVGLVQYCPLNLQSLGDYPILSAAEAWNLVSSEQTDSRVWYQIEAGRWGPQQAQVQLNPRHWGREYQAGESVHLFGPLHLQLPAGSGYPPHIIMNDLVLESDNLAKLAESYQALMLSTGQTETPMHIWGQVEDVGDYLTLQVQGWESAADVQYNWSGTIQWSEGSSWLLTDDGQEIRLSDLPADLVAGTLVYVSGGLWDGRLEWFIIQEHPADEGWMPSTDPLPAEIQASVEGVELVYLFGALSNLSSEHYADPGYRSVQPVWRFNGRTDQGQTFEILVQAVTDNYLFTPPDNH